MNLSYFETNIKEKKYFFVYMGSGVKEVLMVEESLDLGHPRRIINMDGSFSSWEDFYDYHKSFFEDKECVKSFMEEYIN